MIKKSLIKYGSKTPKEILRFNIQYQLIASLNLNLANNL